MSYQIIKNTDNVTLDLPEELGIQCVEVLKNELHPFFESSTPLIVKADRVKQLHTAIIQLFLAWKTSGVPISIQSPSDKMNSLIKRWGLEQQI